MAGRGRFAGHRRLSGVIDLIRARRSLAPPAFRCSSRAGAQGDQGDGGGLQAHFNRADGDVGAAFDGFQIAVGVEHADFVEGRLAPREVPQFDAMERFGAAGVAEVGEEVAAGLEGGGALLLLVRCRR